MDEAITSGLTNDEEGGEMEVQVCWKILVKVHLYVQEGKLQEEYGSHSTFLLHSIFPSALYQIILGYYVHAGDKAVTLQYLSGTFIMI